MLKFNNSDIFTGYLKQLLKSFNLPSYRIYTDDNSIIESIPGPVSSENKHVRYLPYIKENEIQIYMKKQGDPKATWYSFNNQQYIYNKPVLNKTTNFIIKNNVYDSYTHRYLGNYLRFQRDYHKLDLMSMYNCFSDEIAKNINFTAAGHTFNSSDKRYKIYMVPIKFFQKYTIAIDCNLPVEICCGLYDAYIIDDELTKELSTNTYQRYTSLAFTKPVVYNKITAIKEFLTPSAELELATKEDALCMFIKLPINTKSSIVVLEGDYSKYENSVLNIYSTPISKNDEGTTYKINSEVSVNHWITNFETDYEELAVANFKPISPLQLLAINTGISYPFADRLIEYLLYNCITEKDSYYLPDNIKRVQQVMEQNQITTNIDSAWEEKYRPILYDFLLENKNKFDTYYDILGYVDKDIENTYAAIHIVTEYDHEALKKYLDKSVGTKVILDTLKDINIYEEV